MLTQIKAVKIYHIYETKNTSQWLKLHHYIVQKIVRNFNKLTAKNYIHLNIQSKKYSNHAYNYKFMKEQKVMVNFIKYSKEVFIMDKK